MTETSETFPGRRVRRYTPMKSAIGIVMAIENTPHGLAASALTTTRPRIPMTMIMMT